MISSGMRSPWEANPRKSDEDDIFGSRQEQLLLGELLERSTSAPPLPSESNTESGGFRYEEDSESYLFGSARQRASSSRLGLFESSGRDTAPLMSTDAGTFSPGYDSKTGRSTAPGFYDAAAFDEPLFHSGVHDQSNTNNGRRVNDDDQSLAYIFDRNVQETQLVRSQSAAPALFSSGSLGPPPGLGMNTSSSDTYINDMADRHAQTHGEPRRPASTGVIGGHNTSSSVLRSLGLESDGSESGAVRPAPKRMMDLIQEDFPSSPSPLYERGRPHPSHIVYSNEHDSRSHVQTASSTSQYNRADGAPTRVFRAEQQHRVSYDQQDSLGGVTHSMERLHVNARDGYHQREHPPAGVQYISQPSDRIGREHYQEHTGQRSIYVPAEQRLHGGPAPHTHQQQQQSAHHYESQPVYYTERQPRDVPVVAAAPTTMHPVYVDAPPTYGYQTLQYLPGAAAPHHQHQPPRIVHHPSVQGGHPPHEYITVVPLQAGAPGHRMGGVPPQGAYGYWHQPEVSSPPAQGTTRSVAYMNVPSGGTPVAVGRAPISPRDSSGGRQGRHKGGRSPNEKGGKGRRGGGGRRSGVEATSKHSPGGSATSPLLEAFRATKNRDWTILDIRGHVVEFCQDQNGSRFIQQRLEVGDIAEKQMVLTEVLPDVYRLRNDVFGNYVVQKLLEFGTPEMKADLRDTLKGEMLPLSLQMYGCRVVQKALETLSEEDLPSLLVEFHHNVLSCIQDQNGNHVIQKCIEVMSSKAKTARASGDESRARFYSEQIDFIFDDVLDNVESLSCHPYGCRVLQRILEHCIEPKKTWALDEISKCHRRLLDDQYGNYVIQHVLQYGRHSDRESILHIVVENGLLKLSKQKFASNVVEKLLKYGSPGQRNALIREMLQVVDENTGAPMDRNDGGSSVVLLMVRDAYANYVVQTTLDVVSEGEEKRLLLEELNAHSTQLRNYTYAKHIVTKLGI